MAKDNSTLLYLGIGAVVLGGLGFAAWKSGFFVKKQDEVIEEVSQTPEEIAFIKLLQGWINSQYVSKIETPANRINASAYQGLRTASAQTVDQTKAAKYGLQGKTWKDIYAYAQTLESKLTF